MVKMKSLVKVSREKFLCFKTHSASSSENPRTERRTDCKTADGTLSLTEESAPA